MTAVIAKTTYNGNRSVKKPETTSLTKAELRALKRQNRKHRTRR